MEPVKRTSFEISSLVEKSLPLPTNQKLQLSMDSKTLDELSQELAKVMNVKDIQQGAVKAAGLIPAKQRTMQNGNHSVNKSAASDNGINNNSNNNNNTNKKPRAQSILVIPTMSNPKAQLNNTNAAAIKDDKLLPTVIVEKTKKAPRQDEGINDPPKPNSPKRKIRDEEEQQPLVVNSKPNAIKKKQQQQQQNPETEQKKAQPEKKVYPLKDRYKKYIQGVLMNRVDPKWKDYRDAALADVNNGALRDVINRENEMMDSIKSQRAEIASTISKYIQKKIDNSTQAVVKSYNKVQELLYVTINAKGVVGCNVTHLPAQQQPCYITGKKIPKDKAYFVEMSLVDVSKVGDYVDANDKLYKVIVAEEWATFIRNWVLLCNIDNMAIGDYEEWREDKNKGNLKVEHPEQLVARFLSENKGEHLEELFNLSKTAVAYFKDWIQSEQDILREFEQRIEPEWTQ
jgi:hypothetical protein